MTDETRGGEQESVTDAILEMAGHGKAGQPRTALRLVAAYARGCWGWYGLFAVASVAGAAAQLLQPAALAATVDAALAGEGFGTRLWVFGGVLLAGALSALVAGPAEHRFTGAVGARATSDLVDRSLRVGLPGRRPFDDADLLTRVSADAAAVAGYPVFAMTVVMGTVMALVGAVALAVIDWVLLAPFVGVVVALVGVGTVFFRKTMGSERELRNLSNRMTQRFMDALAGHRSIRAARTLPVEVARITEPVGEIAAMGRRLLSLFGKGAALTFSAQFAIVLAVLAVGGWSLSAGRIGAGELVAGMQYGALAFGAAFRIFDYGWFQLAIIQARAARVAEVLETPEAAPEPAEPAAAPVGSGQVEMRDVAVAGNPDRVLDDLNVVVPAGSMVAVVGESGAGKSTIAALTGRLLDPDAGAVRLDGCDLTRLDRQTVADLVAFAFERPTLLGGTIRDSIALGADGAAGDVEAAARAAEADSWISRLPDGYDTPVADAPMSGGELQRLGLARAMLRRPRVLVLDDALSSLDTATEAKVFEAFRAMAAGRTAIVVAHRASTAARADLVAWLSGGRIRAVAPHRQLWENRDYRSVFANQDARSPSPGHAAL